LELERWEGKRWAVEEMKKKNTEHHRIHMEDKGNRVF
jgi:hypothetical protein